MAATMDRHDTANIDAALYIISLFCIIPNVFVKIPQIRNVLASKSLKGLSFNGALLETVVYVVNLSSHFLILTSKTLKKKSGPYGHARRPAAGRGPGAGGWCAAACCRVCRTCECLLEWVRCGFSA